jgi:serine/threonine protein kinase
MALYFKADEKEPSIDVQPDTVSQLRTDLDTKDDTAPIDAFDTACKEMCTFIDSNYYAGFLDREDFENYVQLREYAQRYRIDMKSLNLFRIVGRGAFGNVSAVSKNDSGRVYALKEMNKRMMKAKNLMDHTDNEIKILKLLKTPFCTRLWFVFQDDENLYVIMDYCNGGDLRWHLTNRAEKQSTTGYRCFSEADARFYAAEILMALEHLHDKDIVYRDLKPNNVLMNSRGHVQLSDFGLGDFLADHKSGACSTLSGTPGYWAPEVCARLRYRTEADIWSFGVVLYYFLAGHRPKWKPVNGKWSPFDSEDNQEREKLAKEAKLDACDMTPVAYPAHFSEEAKDLLSKIFEYDQHKRISIPDMQRHPFFASIQWGNLATVEAPYIPNVHDVHTESVADVGQLDFGQYRYVSCSVV